MHEKYMYVCVSNYPPDRKENLMIILIQTWWISKLCLTFRDEVLSTSFLTWENFWNIQSIWYILSVSPIWNTFFTLLPKCQSFWFCFYIDACSGSVPFVLYLLDICFHILNQHLKVTFTIDTWNFETEV